MHALLAHRDARLYLAGQAPSTVGDNALWLATMAVVIVTAAAYLAGVPRARTSPEGGVMPAASDGQSPVPVGSIG